MFDCLVVVPNTKPFQNSFDFSTSWPPFPPSALCCFLADPYLSFSILFGHHSFEKPAVARLQWWCPSLRCPVALCRRTFPSPCVVISIHMTRPEVRHCYLLRTLQWLAMRPKMKSQFLWGGPGITSDLISHLCSQLILFPPCLLPCTHSWRVQVCFTGPWYLSCYWSSCANVISLGGRFPPALSKIAPLWLSVLLCFSPKHLLWLVCVDLCVRVYIFIICIPHLW